MSIEEGMRGERRGGTYRISAFELAQEHACVCCAYAEGFIEEGGQVVF